MNTIGMILGIVAFVEILLGYKSAATNLWIKDLQVSPILFKNGLVIALLAIIAYG